MVIAIAASAVGQMVLYLVLQLVVFPMLVGSDQPSTTASNVFFVLSWLIAVAGGIPIRLSRVRAKLLAGGISGVMGNVINLAMSVFPLAFLMILAMTTLAAAGLISDRAR